jgi:eukaryotic-like serine/threonine-protein kinase
MASSHVRGTAHMPLAACFPSSSAPLLRRGTCLVLSLAALHSAGAQDAWMFRGNPAHTGIYAGPGPRTLDHIKWKFSTGVYMISSAAVVGGTVYVGSTDGRLYAVDAASGTQRWAYKTGARITSSPAVSDGVVYFLSYDDTAYAVDAATGAAKWKFATRGEHRYTATHIHGTLPRAEAMPDMYDTYLSSPVVWRGSVYFGSGDGNVYAVNAATGVLRWKFKTGDVVHSSPAIADSTVYIGGWDTWFYALDARTGKLRWKFKTGDDPEYHNQIGVQSSPAVAGGVVYFGCRDNHLYAVDARTGRKKWSVANNGAWVISSPAVRDGKVYYANADGRSFFELDAATGKQLYSMKSSWYFFSSPAIAGDMAYIGNWDGRLFAIDLATHRTTSVFQTDSSRANLATYIKPDSSMFFGAALGNGREYFYDLHVRALGRIWTMGSFLASPVVADGVVYLGSMDGNLYALTDRP